MSEWTKENEHDMAIYTEGYNDGHEAGVIDSSKNIVRCMDCKYTFPNPNGFCKIAIMLGDPEFSCIKGERKDGAE